MVVVANSEFYLNQCIKIVLFCFADNRTHFCKYITCTKAFRTAEALKVHGLVHTNEKPMKCEFCEYTCRQKSSIKFHMKKKHPELLPNDLVSPKPCTTGSYTVGKSETAADSINKTEPDGINVRSQSSYSVNSIPSSPLQAENPNTSAVENKIKDELESSNHALIDNIDTSEVSFTSTTSKSSLHHENPTENSIKSPVDQNVPSETEINDVSVSTNQSHCNSQTATTSTNDLQDMKDVPANENPRQKAKKTDMYEFQSEDESGDEMKPGRVYYMICS